MLLFNNDLFTVMSASRKLAAKKTAIKIPKSILQKSNVNHVKYQNIIK